MSDEITKPNKAWGLTAIIDRIENPLLRRGFGFVVLFAASLAIGFVCEKAFDRQMLARAYAGQKIWIDKMSALAPLALVRGYWADLGPAGHGEWIYHPPPPHLSSTLTAEELAAINEAGVKSMACELKRFRPRVSPECEASLRSGLSASACIADPAREGCTLYNSCLEASGAALGSLPPECADAPARPFLFIPTETAPAVNPVPAPAARPTAIHPLLTPAAAFVRTLTRLSAGGAWGFALALGQLAMGAAGFFLFMRWGKTDKDDLGLPFLLIAVPIGIVASGSLIALGLKWLMLGAVYAFHSVTGLAAAAAGASGIAGFCWLCASKLAEKGAEAAIAGKA